MKDYIELMRLNKPIGIFLLLWPSLWALCLASQGFPSLSILAIFVVGTILMRSAGCIINDYADRHIDKLVRRTRFRPLTSGKIGVRHALILFVLLCVSAFVLVCFLNVYAIALSVVGLVLAVFYPFLKRYTHLPQVGLGFAFSWGVPMAFAAVQNAIPWQAWVLYAIAVLWPVIYDTLYAMADREDDLKIGVKSTAILFGKSDKKIIGVLQAIFVLSLGGLGLLFHLNYRYDLSLVLVALLFSYQQVCIRDRDPQACFNAFLNNNWVGLCVTVGIFFGLSA